MRLLTLPASPSAVLLQKHDPDGPHVASVSRNVAPAVGRLVLICEAAVGLLLVCMSVKIGQVSLLIVVDCPSTAVQLDEHDHRSAGFVVGGH